MRKFVNDWSKYILMGVLVLIILVLIGVSLRPRRTQVAGINDNGELVLSDGRKIALAGIKVSQKGEDNHNAAIFLLGEMTKNVEIWLQQKSDGYRVWIGCTDRLFTYDCSKGLLINDALVKADMATINP